MSAALGPSTKYGLNIIYYPCRRTCLSSLIACIGFVSSVWCFGQPTFFPVESTPYDRQMGRVQPVLVSLSSQPADEISWATVNQWMTKLNRLPYRYSKQWQTPFEVSATKAADCKGKAIMLYEIMQGSGQGMFASSLADIAPGIGSRMRGWNGKRRTEITFSIQHLTGRLKKRSGRASEKVPSMCAYEGSFKAPCDECNAFRRGAAARGCVWKVTSLVLKALPVYSAVRWAVGAGSSC